eukprot:1803322-Prymnesium_polylepis.1
MNLFVGVIVQNFNRIAKEADGSATMTVEQQQWVDSMKAMGRAKPVNKLRMPSGTHGIARARRRLFRAITHPTFDAIIGGVIVFNVIVMALDYWGIEQSPVIFSYYGRANEFFLYIYYVEFVLKVTAAGRSYFTDQWCQLDFFLVCTSLLDQFARELLTGFIPMPPMLLRILR